MTPISAMRFGWLAGLLFLAACYDAPRDNPFDPALTPPVELQVALDDTAGTATLTWTRYEGKQPFREYQVLRNIADRKSVDTLAYLPQVEQTSFVDSSLAPNTTYVYRVAVLNAGGFDMPSEERSIAEFRVGAISLLAVESDPQEGALVLRWNRYVGPDFHAYQVRRRLGKTLEEVILAELSNIQDTTFVDRTAQAEVGYVYTVKVQAAGQELVSNTQEAHLRLLPVEITRADFVSTDASVSLTWTQYGGPRFHAYQVLRRSVELSPQAVKEAEDIADTSLVDTDLLGNTEYFYQVKVLTERGEEVASEERRGKFHGLVGTWPLPIQVEANPFVRLYAEPGGQIAAVATGSFLAKLILFAQEGQRLNEQVLVQNFVSPSRWSTATTLDAEGRRFLINDYDPGFRADPQWGITSLRPDGSPIIENHELFTGAFPEPLSDPEGVVSGEIALLGSGSFDNVAVSTGGRLLFTEDFEDFPKSNEGLPQTVQNWTFSGMYFNARGVLGTSSPKGTASRSDENWEDFRLEADVLHLRGDKTGIQMGGSTSSHFALWLEEFEQQAVLEWGFSAPGELDLAPQEKEFSVPFALLPGLTYRLGLEAVDGQVRASVQSPVSVIWIDRAVGDSFTGATWQR